MRERRPHFSLGGSEGARGLSALGRTLPRRLASQCSAEKLAKYLGAMQHPAFLVLCCECGLCVSVVCVGKSLRAVCECEKESKNAKM